MSYNHFFIVKDFDSQDKLGNVWYHCAVIILSWNVNGIRACDRKGFSTWLEKRPGNIVCVQETKISDPSQCGDRLKNPDGYQSFWHCATEKKGYSGVGVFTTVAPKNILTAFGQGTLLSKEGRMIEMDFGSFLLFNVYFPNGGSGPLRLRYKLRFYEEWLDEMKSLIKKGKKIILCGDVNTAHKEIDLARPRENRNRSGFMPIERSWLDRFFEAGFVDTFRLFHTGSGHYTWWDMKTRARERNVGWRLDYVFVSSNLKRFVTNGFIQPKVFGSDHCPIGIEIALRH